MMETNTTTINGVVITNKKKKLSGLRRDSSFRVIDPHPTVVQQPITDVSVENVRARAMQAVDYYNSNILADQQQQPQQPNNSSSTYKSLGDVFVSKSKLGKNVSLPLGGTNKYKPSSLQPQQQQPQPRYGRFGSSDTRASYNERLATRMYTNMGPPPPPSTMTSAAYHRSNTSLDLDHEVDMHNYQQPVPTSTQRREFGSHGSIDVIVRSNSTGHHHFDPPPAAVSTLQRKQQPQINNDVVDNSTQDNQPPSSNSSPKVKKKGFFKSGNDKGSIFKKLRGNSLKEGDSLGTSGDSIDRFLDDRHRRRFFSHYDISSVCASLSVSTHLKTLERRNTTTGASAASAALRNGGGESMDDLDQGDHVSNNLVLR